MAALFGTLVDVANVTSLGILRDEMRVDALSGRDFEYGGEMFDGVDLIGSHFGYLDSVRLLKKADDLCSGLDGHISWHCIWNGHFLGK